MQGLMFDSQMLLHSLLWRTERLFAKKEIVTRLGPGEYQPLHLPGFRQTVAAPRRRAEEARTRAGRACGQPCLEYLPPSGDALRSAGDPVRAAYDQLAAFAAAAEVHN